MVMTHSNRVVAAVAGAAIVLSAQAIACQAGAAGAWAEGSRAVVQHTDGTTAQAAAVRYWTPARMGAALSAAAGKPTRTRRLIRRVPAPQASAASSGSRTAGAPGTSGTSGAGAGRSTGDTAGDGIRWTGHDRVAAAVGKIFFTLGSQDYVCSGALVGGKHPDVVLTAAHCVSSGPGTNGAMRWATNWMFVPGYTGGRSPYGEYTARRFLVSPDWTGPNGGREQYDTAFVQVDTATLDGFDGVGVSGTASPPPGLPITFAADQDTAETTTGPLSQTYLFGYPSLLPYSGLYLNYCAGRVVAAGGSVRTACGMTAGDSGGPWLAGFSPRSGTGTIAAVSTYKISGNTRVLYGAVLGPQARSLYQRAVRLVCQSHGPARSPYRSARPPNA